MRPIRSPFLLAFIVSAAVLVGTAVRPPSASAQAGHIAGAVRLDAHLGLGWRGSLGPGLRIDIPLSRDGLISSVNDELALTLGADFLFHTFDGHDHVHDRRDRHHEHDGELTLLFPIAVQWNFILSHNWTVFPELGIAMEHHHEHLHVLLDIGAGARWHFASGQTALLLRLTHPGMFQIGITW